MTTDRERLERVIAEEGVTTDDPQSIGEVAGLLADRAADAVSRWLDGLGGGAMDERLVALLLLVLVGLGLVAAVMAASVVVRGVRALRARPPGPPPRPERAEVGTDAWAEAEAALAVGDAPRALRALWVGVGRGLAAQGVTRFDRETTVREVLVAARRAGFARQDELDRLGRAVEAFLFAGVEPTVERVGAMLPAARRLVGRADG